MLDNIYRDAPSYLAQVHHGDNMDQVCKDNENINNLIQHVLTHLNTFAQFSRFSLSGLSLAFRVTYSTQEHFPFRHLLLWQHTSCNKFVFNLSIKLELRSNSEDLCMTCLLGNSGIRGKDFVMCVLCQLLPDNTCLCWEPLLLLLLLLLLRDQSLE